MSAAQEALRKRRHGAIVDAMRAGRGFGVHERAALVLDALEALEQQATPEERAAERQQRPGGLMVSVGPRRAGNDRYVPPNTPLTVTLTDGSEWVLRPGESQPLGRLEVLLVPGSGPDGEDSVAIRPLATNRAEVWAVRS